MLNMCAYEFKFNLINSKPIQSLQFCSRVHNYTFSTHFSYDPAARKEVDFDLKSRKI